MASGFTLGPVQEPPSPGANVSYAPPGGPSDVAKLNRAYILNQGQFLLHGDHGTAGYVFSNGTFYTDTLQVVGYSTLNANPPVIGWLYKSSESSNFYYFFSDTPFASGSDGSKLYLVYYSMDGQWYYPWPMGIYANTHPLDPEPVTPPTGTTLPQPGHPQPGNANDPSSSQNNIAPDGKKAKYPIHTEGYFGITKGYAWADVGEDGLITLRIEGKHSGVTGSTKFSGAVIVSGYRGGKENIILNKVVTKTLTVAADASGAAKKDGTWSDFPPIAVEDRDNVRHIRVLMAKDKSGDNFVDVVTGMLKSAGVIFGEADSLYCEIKDSELGQAIALAIAAG